MPADSQKVYQETLDRTEPDIHHMDTSACLPSIAISLKRIADALDPNPGQSFNTLTELAYKMGQSFEAGMRNPK